jgi:hypothetical protein
MKKLLTSLLLAGAVIAGGALAPAMAADVGAKFPRISIKSLSFNGSGCPRSDTDGDIIDTDDDGLPDTFFVLFESYIAAMGPGIPITEARKNCNIILVLDLPQGLQFSIVSVRYDGFASLESGVTGQQRSDYSFPLFGSRTATAQTLLRGPLGELYDRTDVLGIASLVWSPCGIDAPLNIRTQVKVYGPPHKSGRMDLDQTVGRMEHVYGFTWRRCNPRPRSG